MSIARTIPTRRRSRMPLLAGMSGGLSLVVAVTLWLLFAPVQLGGPFSIYFVVGDSMEPTITRNDVVFLRTAPTYAVGDVIAYRDPLLETTVMHRIRAMDGERFITRGDNRQSDDPYRPLPSDVTGREWYVFARGARVWAAIQSPSSAILLSIATLALGAVSAKPVTRSRRWRRHVVGKAPNVFGQLSYRSMNGDATLTAASTALFAALAIGAVLVWNGPQRDVAKEDVLNSVGRFNYTGRAGSGIFDGDALRTGDPVFIQIGTQLPVTFEYALEPVTSTASMANVRGTVALKAIVQADNRWKREFELVPPKAFQGEKASVQGTVDLRALQDAATRMEEQAGLRYSFYVTRIVAEVNATAIVSGKPQEIAFEADAPFELHPLQLIPASGFRDTVEKPSNLKRIQTEEWSTTLPIVRKTVDYSTLRLVAIALALGGIAGIGVVGGATWYAARGGETALILSRFAPLIVPVQAADVDFGGRIVAVKKFEDLARMARADGLFIVHAENGVADHFLLVMPEVTYLYSVPRARHAYRFDEEVRPSPNEVVRALSGNPPVPPLGDTPAATSIPAPAASVTGARLIEGTPRRPGGAPATAPATAPTRGTTSGPTNGTTNGVQPSPASPSSLPSAPQGGGKALV